MEYGLLLIGEDHLLENIVLTPDEVVAVFVPPDLHHVAEQRERACDCVHGAFPISTVSVISVVSPGLSAYWET